LAARVTAPSVERRCGPGHDFRESICCVWRFLPPPEARPFIPIRTTQCDARGSCKRSRGAGNCINLSFSRRSTVFGETNLREKNGAGAARRFRAKEKIYAPSA
jgi:hypothetical protein